MSLETKSVTSVRSLLRALYPAADGNDGDHHHHHNQGGGGHSSSECWPTDTDSFVAMSPELELAASRGGRLCTVSFSRNDGSSGRDRGDRGGADGTRVYSDGVRIYPRSDPADGPVTALAWATPRHLCAGYKSGTVLIFCQGIPVMVQRFARSPVVRVTVTSDVSTGIATAKGARAGGGRGTGTGGTGAAPTGGSTGGGGGGGGDGGGSSRRPSIASPGGDLWITHADGTLVQIGVRALVAAMRGTARGATAAAPASTGAGGAGGGGSDANRWTEAPPFTLFQLPRSGAAGSSGGGRGGGGGGGGGGGAGSIRELADTVVARPPKGGLFEPDAEHSSSLLVLAAGTDPSVLLCQISRPLADPGAQANMGQIAAVVASKVLSGVSSAWGSVMSKSPFLAGVWGSAGGSSSASQKPGAADVPPPILEVAAGGGGSGGGSSSSSSGGGGGGGGGSSGSSSSSSSSSKRLSAPSIVAFPDPRRRVSRLTLAPGGYLAVSTDGLGRILLLDTADLRVLRVWKGYRDVQCGWFTAREDPPEMTKLSSSPGGGNSRGGSGAGGGGAAAASPGPGGVSSPGQSPGLRRKPRARHGVAAAGLYLVIYVRSRGRLEIWRMRYGPKVASLRVPPNGRLITLLSGGPASSSSSCSSSSSSSSSPSSSSPPYGSSSGAAGGMDHHLPPGRRGTRHRGANDAGSGGWRTSGNGEDAVTAHGSGANARCFLVLRPGSGNGNDDNDDSDDDDDDDDEGDDDGGGSVDALRGVAADRCVLQEVTLGAGAALAKVFAHYGGGSNQKDRLRLHRFVDGLRRICLYHAAERRRSARRRSRLTSGAGGASVLCPATGGRAPAMSTDSPMGTPSAAAAAAKAEAAVAESRAAVALLGSIESPRTVIRALQMMDDLQRFPLKRGRLLEVPVPLQMRIVRQAARQIAARLQDLLRLQTAHHTAAAMGAGRAHTNKGRVLSRRVRGRVVPLRNTLFILKQRLAVTRTYGLLLQVLVDGDSAGLGDGAEGAKQWESGLLKTVADSDAVLGASSPATAESDRGLHRSMGAVAWCRLYDVIGGSDGSRGGDAVTGASAGPMRCSELWQAVEDGIKAALKRSSSGGGGSGGGNAGSGSANGGSSRTGGQNSLPTALASAASTSERNCLSIVREGSRPGVAQLLFGPLLLDVFAWSHLRQRVIPLLSRWLPTSELAGLFSAWFFAQPFKSLAALPANPAANGIVRWLLWLRAQAKALLVAGRRRQSWAPASPRASERSSTQWSQEAAWAAACAPRAVSLGADGTSRRPRSGSERKDYAADDEAGEGEFWAEDGTGRRIMAPVELDPPLDSAVEQDVALPYFAELTSDCVRRGETAHALLLCRFMTAALIAPPAMAAEEEEDADDGNGEGPSATNASGGGAAAGGADDGDSGDDYLDDFSDGEGDGEMDYGEDNGSDDESDDAGDGSDDRGLRSRPIMSWDETVADTAKRVDSIAALLHVVAFLQQTLFGGRSAADGGRLTVKALLGGAVPGALLAAVHCRLRERGRQLVETGDVAAADDADDAADACLGLIGLPDEPDEPDGPAEPDAAPSDTTSSSEGKAGGAEAQVVEGDVGEAPTASSPAALIAAVTSLQERGVLLLPPLKSAKAGKGGKGGGGVDRDEFPLPTIQAVAAVRKVLPAGAASAEATACHTAWQLAAAWADQIRRWAPGTVQGSKDLGQQPLSPPPGSIELEAAMEALESVAQAGARCPLALLIWNRFLAPAVRGICRDRWGDTYVAAGETGMAQGPVQPVWADAAMCRYVLVQARALLKSVAVDSAADLVAEFHAWEGERAGNASGLDDAAAGVAGLLLPLLDPFVTRLRGAGVKWWAAVQASALTATGGIKGSPGHPLLLRWARDTTALVLCLEGMVQLEETEQQAAAAAAAAAASSSSNAIEATASSSSLRRAGSGRGPSFLAQCVAVDLAAKAKARDATLFEALAPSERPLRLLQPVLDVVGSPPDLVVYLHLKGGGSGSSNRKGRRKGGPRSSAAASHKKGNQDDDLAAAAQEAAADRWNFVRAVLYTGIVSRDSAGTSASSSLAASQGESSSRAVDARRQDHPGVNRAKAIDRGGLLYDLAAALDIDRERLRDEEIYLLYLRGEDIQAAELMGQVGSDVGQPSFLFFVFSPSPACLHLDLTLFVCVVVGAVLVCPSCLLPPSSFSAFCAGPASGVAGDALGGRGQMSHEPDHPGHSAQRPLRSLPFHRRSDGGALDLEGFFHTGC